ncbi:unnamed protein product [Caenorhabditis angaria]|uniref:G-protein coupled receptors family 1 profile domain-containing protein n=1 Tax=Caenorhabditis angaria TaxID=860376 RepID=A0A9P1IJT5_9PELO|nr:unnamed protein product [Caenorhabditis angaria]
MFVNYYYYLFTTISIPVNVLLIYLIIFKSPSSFQSYRVLVSSGESIALLAYGPLRGLPINFIFIIYNLYNVFLTTTNLSLNISMFYRFCLICYGKVNNITMTNLLISSYILPLLMFIAITISKRDFEIVMKNTEKSYPSYNLPIVYGEYCGFYSTKNLIYLVNTTILMGIPYLMPIFILYCRRKILKQINEVQTHLSYKTKKASLDLVQALTLQAMFPMICIIPNVLYFAFAQTSHMEFEFAEFSGFPMCCLPCLIDPILMIKYVTPFNNFVFRKRKNVIKVPTASMVHSIHRTA